MNPGMVGLRLFQQTHFPEKHLRQHGATTLRAPVHDDFVLVVFEGSDFGKQDFMAANYIAKVR